MGHQIEQVQHFRNKQNFHALQEFDRRKISFEKYGKDVNVYDYIQSNNVDTDIYEVAKKYNNGIADVTTCASYMRKNLNELSEEFAEMQDLKSVLEKQIKATNMWNALPVSVRAAFNNDKAEFLDNGENWLKKQKELVQTAAQKKNEQQQQQPGTAQGVK